VAGRVEAICIGDRRGVVKTPVAAAELREEHGLVGDVHAGGGHRQLSLLAQSDVEAYGKALGHDVAPGAFAENLVIAGLDFGAIGLGTRLRVGRGAVLSVTRVGGSYEGHGAPLVQSEPRPGHRLMPREGLFARVVQGGAIAVGDEVAVEQLIPRTQFQAVVLTLSDRCAAGVAVDTTGPAVASLVRDELGAHIFASEILPDGQDGLAARLRAYADDHGVDIILAAGGTGPSPRDQTPEAVRAVVQRLTPGFDEVMRHASLASTPLAMLSRACSGIRGSTLIVSLPGSERGATENLRAILPALPHCLQKLRGDPAECGRPGP
jgi:molybdopterin adenylyltransferase